MTNPIGSARPLTPKPTNIQTSKKATKASQVPHPPHSSIDPIYDEILRLAEFHKTSESHIVPGYTEAHTEPYLKSIYEQLKKLEPKKERLKKEISLFRERGLQAGMMVAQETLSSISHEIHKLNRAIKIIEVNCKHIQTANTSTIQEGRALLVPKKSVGLTQFEPIRKGFPQQPLTYEAIIELANPGTNPEEVIIPNYDPQKTSQYLREINGDLITFSPNDTQAQELIARDNLAIEIINANHRRLAIPLDLTPILEIAKSPKMLSETLISDYAPKKTAVYLSQVKEELSKNPDELKAKALHRAELIILYNHHQKASKNMPMTWDQFHQKNRIIPQKVKVHRQNGSEVLKNQFRVGGVDIVLHHSFVKKGDELGHGVYGRARDAMIRIGPDVTVVAKKQRVENWEAFFKLVEEVELSQELASSQNVLVSQQYFLYQGKQKFKMIVEKDPSTEEEIPRTVDATNNMMIIMPKCKPLASYKYQTDTAGNLFFRHMHQAAQGLADLEKKSIIHNDCKKENILVGATDDQAKLIDFGLSGHAAQLLDKPFEFGGTNYPPEAVLLRAKCYNNYFLNLSSAEKVVYVQDKLGLDIHNFSKIDSWAWGYTVVRVLCEADIAQLKTQRKNLHQQIRQNARQHLPESASGPLQVQDKLDATKAEILRLKGLVENYQKHEDLRLYTKENPYDCNPVYVRQADMTDYLTNYNDKLLKGRDLNNPYLRDLLSKCLALDPSRRLSPTDIVDHPFWTATQTESRKVLNRPDKKLAAKKEDQLYEVSPSSSAISVVLSPMTPDNQTDKSEPDSPET